MSVLKTHHQSEAWLRALTVQRNHVNAHTATTTDAVQAMVGPTNTYLRAKHARSPAERDECLRKLVTIAASKGLTALAAKICESQLSSAWSTLPQPQSGPPSPPRRVAPPPLPKAFCAEQQMYLSLLGYVASTDSASPHACEALRFFGALAHPFSTALVQGQLGDLRGDQPALKLDGIRATLEPGTEGPVAVLNALGERLGPCFAAAQEILARTQDDTIVRGLVAALDIAPPGMALIELAEAITSPGGLALARELTAMRAAERAGQVMQATLHRARALAQFAKSDPVSHDVLNKLSAPLDGPLRRYFDHPTNMQDEGIWTSLVKETLWAMRDVGAACQAKGPGLNPICYWVPDIANIAHYRQILAFCHAAQPTGRRATYTMLRFLMRMEGPARPLSTRKPTEPELQPVDHEACTCTNQKQHAAASIANPGEPLFIKLHRHLEVIVHGEFVERVGPFLQSAADDFAAGLQLVYRADQRVGSWDKLGVLFRDWLSQACLDGKRQVLGEFLTAQGLQEGPDLSLVADLHADQTTDEKVTELLRVFREETLRAYAQRNHLDAHDVASIERGHGFVRHDYNDQTFHAYLRNSDLCVDMSDTQIAALVDYQVDTLCVLERCDPVRER